uniref:Uncharacterized protein n=1 Tax=Panagrolaimus sp. ES5 TaxID=591445 RepID=A0AC34FDX2_9BILA
MDGDPLQIPRRLATYQASVCFQDVDPQEFEELLSSYSHYIQLLYERRLNWFRHRNDSSNPGQASNQTRCEKIWGDFRRGYIFLFCTWADLPHQVNRPEAKKLWGDKKKGRDEAT